MSEPNETPTNASANPWQPLILGIFSSFLWTAGFVAITWGGQSPIWSRMGVLAALGLLPVAHVAASGGGALRVRGRYWLGAGLFGLGHLPALGLAHWYIWKTAAPAFIPLLIYLAAFPALAIYFTSLLRAKCPRVPLALALPCVWVAIEIVRGEWLIGGYPWYLVGHALTFESGPAWPARMVGAYGCSLVVAMAACAAYELARRVHAGGLRSGVGYSVFLAALIGLGLSTFVPATTPPVFRSFRVAVLQTNLPQDNKLGWPLADRVVTHRHWLALSEQAAAQPKRPQLIVWPETMFPGLALNPESIEAQRRAGLTYSAAASGTGGPLPVTWFADALIDTQTRCNIPFLIGSIAIDGLRFTADGEGVRPTSDARTNSAILVTDGAAQPARYDKVDLMAFGEYIPVVYRWPGVQSWLTGLGAHGMAFDLAFGTGRSLFDIEGVRTGTPICFEVCHEAACRAFTTTADGKRRADLLINITNDGWFYESAFNRQMHLLQARWRCAELATPMVRAANTGISCVIDASGKVLTPSLDGGKPQDQTEGVLTADVPLTDPAAPPTFYARVGHHLSTLIVAIGAALAALALFPRPRAAEPGSPLAS